MKKTKWFLWLLLIAMITPQLKAQNTCATSLTLSENSGWRGLDSFDVGERWHQFTAVGTEYEIKLYIRNYPSGFYSTIEVYDGSCGSLSSLGATLNDVGDTITINLTGLTPSNDYFIQMRNGDSPNYEVYNIQLKNLNTLNPVLGGCSLSGSCAITNTVCELVCNGSFECIDPQWPIYAGGPHEIYKVSNWQSTAFLNSPDLFTDPGVFDWNICNYFGYQTPYPSPAYAPNNKRYVGIMVATQTNTNNIQYQEYIQTKLNKPLVAGRNYIVSFYSSMAENPRLIVGNPPIWLTQAQINYSVSTNLVFGILPAGSGTAMPTVNPNPNVGTWQKVMYCYKAVGGEQFLTIGGLPILGNAIHSQTCSGTPASVYGMVPYTQQGYLYIDEVSMTELNFNIPLSYTICNSNTVQIANTQTCLPTDMNLTYTWSPNTALSNPNIFNPIASPTITTNYTFNITPTFTAGGSCPNITNTVSVFNAPLTTPVVSATSTLSCPNVTIGLSANIPAYSYTWNPGALTGSNVVVTFTGITTYTCVYTNSVGCSKTVTIQVKSKVPSNFTLSATASNYTVCTNLGQSTTLTANSNTATGITYTWQPVALTGSQVVVTPTAPTIYTLNATLNGCLLTRTVSINTKNNCCSTTLTAFSATSIPTSTTLGSSFAFNNDLEIGPGADVNFQNAEFVFAPNVKITVKPGGRMNLEGAHLYACGTDLWQGVVLEDGSRFAASNGSNDNLFEDALVGVDVTNHATSTYTTFNLSGILHIEKTTFNKNFISIRIQNYQRTFTPYPFVIESCVFTSRSLTFSPTSWPSTSTVSPGLRAVTNNTMGLEVPYLLNNVALSNLKSPYNSQPSHKGIELLNVGASTGTNIVQYPIQIGKTANYTEYNIFDNHGQGIEGVNSSIRSLNNVFQNSQQYSYDPPGPPPAYTFGGNGIYAGVNNDFNALLETGSTSSSYSSRFYNCHYAINTDKMYKLGIIYNTIRSTHTSTNISSATGSVGIVARTNRFSYAISNNNIANVHTAINIVTSANSYTGNSGSGFGIYAAQMDIQNNYIGSQTTTAAFTSTQYVSQAISISAPTGTAFTTVGSGFAINSNTIDKVYRGIEINSFSKTNFASTTNTNTIKLVNDNVFNAPQNAIRFTNNTVGTVRGNTLSAANTTNTLVSLFYGGSSTTSSITCNTLSNSWRAFEFNSSNTNTFWRGNTMSTHAQGLVLSGTGVISVQGSSGNPIENQWLGSWATSNGTYIDNSTAIGSGLWYRNTGAYAPPTPSGNVSSSFWYGAAGTLTNTTGSYACTSGGGGGGGNFAASSMASSNSQNIFTTNSSLSEDVNYIQQEAKYKVVKENNLSSSLSSTDLTNYNTLQNSSHGKFRNVEGNLYSGNFSSANALNSAITTTNGVEQNYKDFYTLYHKYYTTGLSQTDENALVSIANLCPSKDGAVVYQARALRAYASAGVFYYPNDCSNVFASRGANADGVENFLLNNWNVGVYPNPNTGNFSIISKNEKENLQVTVCDVSGKLLINSSVVTENFVYLLNANLENGIYLVTIKSSSGESVTKKVIVSK